MRDLILTVIYLFKSKTTLKSRNLLFKKNIVFWFKKTYFEYYFYYTLLHNIFAMCYYHSFLNFFCAFGASQVTLVVKNPPANAGDTGDANSISGPGRLYGGEHGNTLQYSCLENPMDRWAWWVIVHRVAKSWTRLKRQHACKPPIFNLFLCFLNVKSVKNSLISFGFLNNLFIFNGYIIFKIKKMFYLQNF